MQSITSRDNPKLKSAIRLHDSRGRRQQGRIIVFGAAEIARGAASGIRFQELFCDGGSQEQLLELVGNQPALSDSGMYSLPEPLFQKLSFGDRKSGFVATAERPSTDIKDFNPSKNALVLVLEAIEKPGNVGAVFRSASGAGVEAILLADRITDCFHPNVIRSSLGSLFSIPVFEASSEQTLDILREKDFQIVTTRVDGRTSCYDCDMRKRSAIVMGNEANGLSDSWTGDGITAVQVPMAGEIDSLNIAMTATLLAYEAYRQRHTA